MGKNEPKGREGKRRRGGITREKMETGRDEEEEKNRLKNE